MSSIIKIGDIVKLLFEINKEKYSYGIVTKIDQPFYYVLWLQTSDKTRHYEGSLHVVSSS
jgi:hypothetical protein